MLQSEQTNLIRTYIHLVNYSLEVAKWRLEIQSAISLGRCWALTRTSSSSVWRLYILFDIDDLKKCCQNNGEREFSFYFNQATHPPTFPLIVDVRRKNNRGRPTCRFSFGLPVIRGLCLTRKKHEMSMWRREQLPYRRGHIPLRLLFPFLFYKLHLSIAATAAFNPGWAACEKR